VTVSVDPNDEEKEGEQSIVAEENAEAEEGNAERPFRASRLYYVFASFLFCIIAYLIWAFFGLCSAFFGMSIYIPFAHDGTSALIWVVAGIVVATILTAIFMPLDKE
jgi:hypothetical protein